VAGGVQSLSMTPLVNWRIPGPELKFEERWMPPTHPETPDAPCKAMPLTLQAGESDFGWRSVPDVGVVEALSGELGAAGSFGDAGVGAESSGWVGAGEDLGEGVAEAGGESVRGKNPPAR
jgi:hypothetical protein